MSNGCHCDSRVRQINARPLHLLICLMAVTVTAVVAKSMPGHHSKGLPFMAVTVTTVVT